MKLFLKIAFLGTEYCGYQVQNNAVTVQQKMNEAAEKLFGFRCDIVGCSRTDSGVHANEFCMAVSKRGENRLEHSIPMKKVPTAFNSLLPDDISVLEALMVEESFHPRYDVKYKEYIYKMWNGRVKDPFLGDRAYRLPFYINDDAFFKMRRAADAFVGKHDFTSFMSSGSKISDAVRTVYCADVIRDGEFVVFKVSADGFLYNMVRIMVGTLVDVARGNIEADDIESIIEARNRSLAGATAPPHGLYLNRVSYNDWHNNACGNGGKTYDELYH